MSTQVAVIVGLIITTVAVKAVGPVALGGRVLPAAFTRVIALMAPALLAALIVTNALADAKEIGIGADTAGVAASGIVMWKFDSVLGAVLVAAVVTAALRALGV